MDILLLIHRIWLYVAISFWTSPLLRPATLATYPSNFKALRFVIETSPKQVDSCLEIVKFGRKIMMSSLVTVRKSIFIRAQQDLLELMGYLQCNCNSVKYMGEKNTLPPLYCRASTIKEGKMSCLLKSVNVLNLLYIQSCEGKMPSHLPEQCRAL